MRAYISAVVQAAADAPNVAEKVRILHKNDHIALRTYLKMALDTNLRWALPEGAPPYKSPPKEESINLENVLYNELRRMYIFIEGGNPRLTPARREMLFVTMLESLHPKDAEFLVNVVKDKKLPDGLTRDVILTAFPNL